MSDPFLALDHFTIKDHGDGREKAVWPVVTNELGGYEAFWHALIDLLTNRVDQDYRLRLDSAPIWHSPRIRKTGNAQLLRFVLRGIGTRSNGRR